MQSSQREAITDDTRFSLTEKGIAALEELFTNAAVDALRASETAGEAFPAPMPCEVRGADQPDPSWVCGTCPICGSPLVNNCYHIGGRHGTIIRWECWLSLDAVPACNYRRVL